MLDFYAVERLEPWPDDIPAASRLVGSMELRHFQSCAAVLQTCLGRFGIECSYFKDWIVPREELGALLRCLRQSPGAAEAMANPRTGLATLIAIIARAEGSTLLAVCD